MKRSAVCLICLAFAGRAVYTQTVEWPYDQQYRQQERQTLADSNRTDFSSRQSLYINTFTNRDSLSIMNAGKAATMHQSVLYDLNYNTVAQTRNEYFDLSGSTLRKGLLQPGGALGVDWTPVLILNSNVANQAVLGSMDIGPVARLGLFHIPLTLRGGYAVKRWSDNLAAGNVFSRFTESLQSDNGYYGAFEFGDDVTSLPLIPIKAVVKGYGRNMETAKMIAGDAAFSLTRRVATGDSVFVMYNDSLIDGRDAMLSEAGAGKSRYINDSRRIERSYQVSAGFKGKYRFSLQPAFAYSFSRYSVQFPANGILTADRRNTDNSITMLLRTDSSAMVNYRGALYIGWENEEKLGGKTMEMKINADNSNVDSLHVVLNDYNGYRAVMEHSLSYYAPNGIGLQYSFAVSRYSQTYPRFFLTGQDTIRNFDDNDWIVQKHHLDATVVSFRKGKILASGEYSSNLRYYLKKERSADNATDEVFRAGITVLYSPLEKIHFDEEVQAEAKRTTYSFPAIQANNLNFAPYSRRFLSKAGVHWNFFRQDTIHALWNEIYTDQGYWYNSSYSDSGASGALNIYYAILNKTWDHTLTLMGNHTFRDGVVLAAGSSIQGIYALDFKARAYRPNPLMIKYVVVPFLTISSLLNEHMHIQGKIRRYIDTIADDYWDFSMVFNIGF